MNKYINDTMSTKTLIGCLCFFIVAVTTTQSLPVNDHQHTQTHEQTGNSVNKDLLTVNGFRSFDDVSSFLRAWFRRIQSRVMAAETDHVSQSRSKRDYSFSGVQLDVSNNSTDEEAFEEYEKEYLIQQTMAALKTLYYHKEYVDYLRSKKTDNHRKPSDVKGSTAAPPPTESNESNVPDFNRVDPILEAKLNELRRLNNDALNRIYRDVRRAAEDGVVDSSIASLCCQIAG